MALAKCPCAFRLRRLARNGVPGFASCIFIVNISTQIGSCEMSMVPFDCAGSQKTGVAVLVSCIFPYTLGLATCPCAFALPRDLLWGACTEILPRNLLWRSCSKILPRDLLQRSCQQSSCRDLVRRSCQKTSSGDIVQRPCEASSDFAQRSFIESLNRELMRSLQERLYTDFLPGHLF